MRLITKKDLIKNILKAWDTQYGNLCDNRKKTIGDRLRNENPQTEEQIADILGNTSWTENRCNECGKDSPAIIQLGEEPDYESATAYICLECLKKALAIVESLPNN